MSSSAAGGLLHRLLHRLLVFALLARLALIVPTAGAEAISSAQYEAPVTRYGHFALGQPHEYARLTVSSGSGQRYAFELPDDAVFEDLAPRLVTLAAGEAPQLLTIVSQRDNGARLVLIGLRDGRLQISAQSPAIGTPMRWLNPVGVADLDGDGEAEIAAVITPHRSGTLKVYRRRGKQLVEIAALAGVSNHVYGSSEPGLSAAISLAGRVVLVVPDSSRRQLKIIALDDGRLRETAHCPLAAPLTGAIRPLPASELSVGLASGRQSIVLHDCPASEPADRSAPATHQRDAVRTSAAGLLKHRRLHAAERVDG